MYLCFAARAQLLASAATAVEYEVSASQDFEAECLMKVSPGDSCLLLNGDHKHDGLTRTHGTADARITIRCESFEACIKGSNTQDRALQIAHDYYTIEGCCFDGSHGNDEYVATAIYVLGEDRATEKQHGIKASVTGTELIDLEIKNWDQECVHLRYFVTFTEMRGCTVQYCGRHAFENGGGGAVGEAMYVGTALDQVDDGKVRVVCVRGLPFAAAAAGAFAPPQRCIWAHGRLSGFHELWMRAFFVVRGKTRSPFFV